ncbi:hypothetical protein MTO96_033544 [Rhipicephalus appendiculatus]
MTIYKERLYDNTIGTALFFEAPAGAVSTRVYTCHLDASLAEATVQHRTCGEDEENIEHIGLQSEHLYPRQSDGTTPP